MLSQVSFLPIFLWNNMDSLCKEQTPHNLASEGSDNQASDNTGNCGSIVI